MPSNSTIPRDSNRKVVTIFGPKGIRGWRVAQNSQGNNHKRHFERRELSRAGARRIDVLLFAHLLPKDFHWPNPTEARRKESTLT